MGGDVRNIQGGQRLLGCGRIVIGRTANQAEPGQADQCIDCRLAIFPEEGVNGRAAVESGCKGWDHPQALGLKRCDHAVIMGRVAREHIGTHQQQPDGAGGARRVRACTHRRVGERSETIGNAASRKVRVINPGLGIFRGRRHCQRAPQRRPLARRVSVDQKAHQCGHIVV